jgi:hypothetical protein
VVGPIVSLVALVGLGSDSPHAGCYNDLSSSALRQGLRPVSCLHSRLTFLRGFGYWRFALCGVMGFNEKVDEFF